MALRFLNLDRPSTRRLKPGERITEHGITAESLRDGDLRYSVAVMVDGKRAFTGLLEERVMVLPGRSAKISSRRSGPKPALADRRCQWAGNWL